MMSLWDALRMNMMISYQELVRTFLSWLSALTLTPRKVSNCSPVRVVMVSSLLLTNLSIDCILSHASGMDADGTGLPVSYSLMVAPIKKPAYAG